MTVYDDALTYKISESKTSKHSVTNEVGIGSSMHDFFADFWIKTRTSPSIKGQNDSIGCKGN